MSIFGRSSEEKQQITIVEELRHLLAAVHLPRAVAEVAQRELEVLSRVGPTAPEYAIGLMYLEYLASLPWAKTTEDALDLARARKILNERHHGLEKIKERVLEHLAVRIMAARKCPRLLVVDDEEIARKNLDHMLSKEGYSVITAPDGAAALTELGKGGFDVVLTDLRMERVDGITLLEKIRISHPETKVILVTAYGTVDTAVEAMKKGAFHFITKPFKFDEVRATVKQALESKHAATAARGSVLCFAGPPGTGKTSIGEAIAEALGRRSSRLSLGGIRDEAEIRGHRRTYAGAMPGRIIEEIRRLQVRNPVLMLDEADKIGGDFKGDPASALLEALDPEQNHSFVDHYLDVPFDLSGVIFIITANVAENMPDALRDRMEVIEFTGYTEGEKVHIAKRYLVPRQIEAQGLTGYPPAFAEEALQRIIQEHTREAGIRGLEREIATICRKIVTRHFDRRELAAKVTVTADSIDDYLGPRKYDLEVADDKNRVGVATGLVRTETGGHIMFVEAAKMRGDKELILTGSLGIVMRESAQAALSYVRSNAHSYGIPEDFFENQDIHIHVPAGSIPKDGPSAGAAMVVALISLLTGRAVKRDVAVTGELTLSGRILPVGGIKEKLLAARRAGVGTVVLPSKNRVDVETLGSDVTIGLIIRFINTVDEIVGLALDTAPHTSS